MNRNEPGARDSREPPRPGSAHRRGPRYSDFRGGTEITSGPPLLPFSVSARARSCIFVLGETRRRYAQSIAAALFSSLLGPEAAEPLKREFLFFICARFAHVRRRAAVFHSRATPEIAGGVTAEKIIVRERPLVLKARETKVIHIDRGIIGCRLEKTVTL